MEKRDRINQHNNLKMHLHSIKMLHATYILYNSLQREMFIITRLKNISSVVAEIII